MYKRVFLGAFFLGLLSVALIFSLGFFFSSVPLTGNVIFDTSTQLQFDQGTYENTTYNGGAVILAGSNLTGLYTSTVFGAGDSAQWNNLSWVSGSDSPVLFVRSCDDSVCSGDAWNQILLSSPGILQVQNQSYFQYRLFFARANTSIDPSVSSVSVDYTLSPLSPTVLIDSPQNGAVYNLNTSIPLSFTAYDLNLSQCWYSLDGASAVSLAGCANSTLSVSFGAHSLTLFANDSDGLVGSAQADFGVSNSTPSVYLISPSEGFATNLSTQRFFYYANDSALQGCNLDSDFSGAWGVSASNDTVPSGVSYFDVDLDQEGSRLWGIECFNLAGLTSVSANRTLVVDSASPVVSLTSPQGSYNSRANIPIDLNVVDASMVSCIYSVVKVGAGTILVVVMPHCASTSFNVAENGDYQFAVTVADQSGNVGVSSTSFSVSSNSNNGGGTNDGGQVSVNLENLVLPRLSYGSLPDIRLRSGFSANYSLDLINTGNTFLNNCSLKLPGSQSDWFSSSVTHSLSPGQHTPYPFSLMLPRDSAAGNTSLALRAICSEVSLSIPLEVTITPAEFAFSVLSYSRVGTQLMVNYSIEELTGHDASISLVYRLLTSEGDEVAGGNEVINLTSRVQAERSLLFELPKDSVGEFTLAFTISTPLDTIEVRHPVFLSGSDISGFAVSNDNKNTLQYWAFGLIAVGLGLFVWRFLRRRYQANSFSQ